MLVVNIPDAAPLSSADFFSTVVVISFSTSSSSMARPLIVSMGEIKLQTRFNPGLQGGHCIGDCTPTATGVKVRSSGGVKLGIGGIDLLERL